jgi:pre-mRNA-processing factor SLU7
LGGHLINYFPLQALEKGQDVHMQANPSLAETMFQQFKAKKEALLKNTKGDVLSKYGNVAEKAPEDLALLTGSER